MTATFLRVATNHNVSAWLLGILVAYLTGCGTSPIAEIGTYAYEGNAVRMQDGVPFIGLGAGEANKIEIASASHRQKTFERIKVFIDDADMNSVDTTASESNVSFDETKLLQNLKLAVGDASVKYNRFNRIDDRSSADVIIKPSVSTVLAWGDWSKTTESLANQYNIPLDKIDKIADISREGIDLLITLRFSTHTDGQIAASSVVGRLVSRRGEMISSIDGSNNNWDSNVNVRNAKIDPKRLPQVVAEAADGAIIASFKQIDRFLWQTEPDQNGIFQKNQR